MYVNKVEKRVMAALLPQQGGVGTISQSSQSYPGTESSMGIIITTERPGM